MIQESFCLLLLELILNRKRFMDGYTIYGSYGTLHADSTSFQRLRSTGTSLRVTAVVRKGNHGQKIISNW